MQSQCIYVFDTATANAAALAVKEGRCSSINQYHMEKHQSMQPPVAPHPGMVQQPPNQLSNVPQHPMNGQPTQTVYPSPNTNGPSPYPPQQQHHVPSPNHMQPGLTTPYEPNLSPQKMKDRESKLERLGLLAHQITPQHPPPTMTQMPVTNMAPPIQPQPAMQSTFSQDPNATQQPGSNQVPTIQPIASPAQQQPPPATQQQQQQVQMKREPQQMDPLSSMEALSECPDLDSYGHTIHHKPL